MDQQHQSRWLGRVLWVGAGILAVIVVLLLILIGYDDYPLTTGFGQSAVPNDVQPAKTLWDWLDLLIVPIVLAIGGFLFTRSEQKATQAAAEQRAQDEALQVYLDQMSQLLLTDTHHPLQKAQRGDSPTVVARARTLTTLRRLGSERKRNVLEFLYESRLISTDRPDPKNSPVIDLRGADLRETNLSYAKLYTNPDGRIMGINLSGADLSRANLRRAHLTEADLSDADLTRANLSDARLQETTLAGADLSDANLRRANLAKSSDPGSTGGSTEFSSAVSDETQRNDAPINNDARVANLTGTYLISANLSGADLREANLSEADLRYANLTYTNLRKADLSRADLSYAKLFLAKGWTEEQLTASKSLEGATMPDGQKYEDWLKDREGSGKDAESE